MKFMNFLGKTLKNMTSDGENTPNKENGFSEMSPIQRVLMIKIGVGVAIAFFFIIVVVLLTSMTGAQTINIHDSRMLPSYESGQNAFEDQMLEEVPKRILTDTIVKDKTVREKEDAYYSALGAAYRQYIGRTSSNNFFGNLTEWWKNIFGRTDVQMLSKANPPFQVQIDTSLITSTLYANRFYMSMINDDSVSQFFNADDTDYYDIHSVSFRDKIERQYFEDSMSQDVNTKRQAIEGIQVLAKYMIQKRSGYTTFYENDSVTEKEDTTLHTLYGVTYVTLDGCRPFVDFSGVQVSYNGIIPKVTGDYKWLPSNSSEASSDSEKYNQCLSSIGNDAALNNLAHQYDTGEPNNTPATYRLDCDGYKKYLQAKTENGDTYPTKEDRIKSCGGEENCYQYSFLEAYYHSYVTKDNNGLPNTEQLVSTIYGMVSFYENSTGIYNTCSPNFKKTEGDLSCGAGATGGCAYNNATVDIIDQSGNIIQEGVPFKDYIIGVQIPEIGAPGDAATNAATKEYIKAHMVSSITYALARSSWKHNATGSKLVMIASEADQMFCDPKQECYIYARGVHGKYEQAYSKSYVDSHSNLGSNTKRRPKALTDEQYQTMSVMYDEVSSYVIVKNTDEAYPTSWGYSYEVGYTATDQVLWRRQAKEGMTFEQILNATYGQGGYRINEHVRNKGGYHKLFTCAGYEPTYDQGNVATDAPPTIYTSPNTKDCISPYVCYKQGDYGKEFYNATGGNNAMSGSGCMPTAIGIIASGLNVQDKNGDIYTPLTVVSDIIYGPGVCPSESACSNITNAGHALTKLGFRISERMTNLSSSSQQERIKEHLRKGYPVLYHVYGASPYSYKGHYMALIGINSDGYVFLSDPGSRGKTNGKGNRVNTYLDLAKMVGRRNDDCYLVYPKR